MSAYIKRGPIALTMVWPLWILQVGRVKIRGLSAANSIRVSKPDGRRSFLKRRRCSPKPASGARCCRDAR